MPSWWQWEHSCPTPRLRALARGFGAHGRVGHHHGVARVSALAATAEDGDHHGNSKARPRVAGFRIQLFIIAFLLVFLLSISLSGNTKRPETEPAFPSPRQSAEGIRLTESKSSARTVAKVAGSIRGASTDRGASWLLTGRRLPRAWRLRQSPVEPPPLVWPRPVAVRPRWCNSARYHGWREPSRSADSRTSWAPGFAGPVGHHVLGHRRVRNQPLGVGDPLLQEAGAEPRGHLPQVGTVDHLFTPGRLELADGMALDARRPCWPSSDQPAPR